MTKDSDTTWSFHIPFVTIEKDDKFDFFFTYESNGLAYDTSKDTYTYPENNVIIEAPPTPETQKPQPISINEPATYFSESGDYISSMQLDAVGNLRFSFICIDGCNFVDLHYRFNNDENQENHRMKAPEGDNAWTYIIQDIKAETSITYYFTHEENNLAYDTDEVTYAIVARRKYLLRKQM